jgi:UDP-N-acetylmuramate dehydrogenase
MELLKDIPLVPYTTLKIGGLAQYFCQATTKNELLAALNSPLKPKTILGNGSNVLISDSGFHGLVIKNSVSKINYLDNYQVLVGTGTSLPLLITDTVNHHLTGLEEFAHIPGTVGGAVYCNIHGVNKNNFDKFLISVEIYDLNSSKIRHLPSKDLRWDYDFSEFQQKPHLIILSVTLQLSLGNKNQSIDTVRQIISQKSSRQPTNSLGCVFKNPPNDSAGRIIDEDLKLKGFRIGDAQVSEKHANFIINLGHATASDYLLVIHHIQSLAKSKLNLDLVPEIQFLGDFSPPSK